MRRRFSPARCRILGAVVAGLAGALLAGTTPWATGNLEVVTQSGTKIGNRLWDPKTVPFGWSFNDPGTGTPSCKYKSTTAPIGDLLPATQSSFDRWGTIPHATLAFQFEGTTSVRNVALDGVNVVTFCSNTAFAPGVLGQTPSFALTEDETVTLGGGCPAGEGMLASGGFCLPAGVYPAGSIVDANIDINTRDTSEQRLTTTGGGGLFDVESLLTHEIGHFVGLSHDPIFGTTMYPFIDDVPFSDGLGQAILKTADISTAARYYPAPDFATETGTITGTITLDGARAHGVHVVAIDSATMKGVAGRFSISSFEDPFALGPEGADFSDSGIGFYRIDGLPPGDYHVLVEYFTNSDFITGRLRNRYNTTVANSSVSNGNAGAAGQSSSWAGFIPRLIEFHDRTPGGANDTGDGGDGFSPGTAADNADAAALVTVAAGQTVPDIDIAINIEPVNGELPPERENPTARLILENDAIMSGDSFTAFRLDGGGDDFYAVRFPASLLPAPPYNIAEGLWARGGLATQPMRTSLAFADPADPSVPAIDDLVIASAGRVLSGGPGGAVAAGDFTDVRDQWNLTVNQARDIYVVLHQPDSAPDVAFITRGFFYMFTCMADVTPPFDGACDDTRVGRTIVTEDGGATWSVMTNGDLFYDLILETAPPVMITGVTPSSLTEGETAAITVHGAGFVEGADVDLGPGVVVDAVTFVDSGTLNADVSVIDSGATEPRDASVTVTNPGVLFPNVARVFTILPRLDQDLDGEPDATDCAPLDPSLKLPATEVEGVVIVDLGGSTALSWISQDPVAGEATVYDILAGSVGDLRAEGGFASAVCVADDHPDSPIIDPAPDPAPGQARYWLVRSSNACNAGGGTYGASNAATNFRAAIDGGAPCPG